MITSRLNKRLSLAIDFLTSMRLASWIFVGSIALIILICLAWCLGEPTINNIFSWLNLQQENPPFWLKVPIDDQLNLLLPTILSVIISQIVMKISPRPRPWSLAVIVGIILALIIRYVVWRSTSTLNLVDPLNGIFSLGLFFSEIILILASVILLYITPQTQDRRRQADLMQMAVIEGKFQPSVDILIPSYNEPEFILRRTIVGCQALEYTNKKIYLLDDTRRANIKELAAELGCQYITRPDNLYAKAGNLNHAIKITNSELILVFDADFIPTKNFLTRTVGFFQNPEIALLQTPQSFYNQDIIAFNLGLKGVFISDEEVFYRQIEQIKESVGSLVCAGTSFLVRRKTLESVGCFVTDSICEDYFTGIKISAQGNKLVYLNEKLSAGLAAENIDSYITQRQRWARGTLQAFFINANPLTIKGLKLLQRMAHTESFLCWFGIIARLGLIFMPLAYLLLGVVPVKATSAELIYFCLPYYLLQFSSFRWRNYRSCSVLFSDIYFFIQCVPIAITIVQTLINPFNKGFKVTDKGIERKGFVFNWQMGRPLLILVSLTTLGLCNILMRKFMALPSDPSAQGMEIMLFFSVYNLIMMLVCLLVLFDAPKTNNYQWFNQEKMIGLTLNNQELFGVTTAISEAGAKISLKSANLDTNPDFTQVKVEFLDQGLILNGVIKNINITRKETNIEVNFTQVTSRQYRELIEMLFCRPGQWKNQEAPGEIKSIFLLLKVLFSPRFLSRNKAEI